MRERPHIAVLVEVAYPSAVEAEKDALLLFDEGAVGRAVAGGPDALSDAARKVAVLIDGVRALRSAPLMGMDAHDTQFGALSCSFGTLFCLLVADAGAFAGAGDALFAAGGAPLFEAGLPRKAAGGAALCRTGKGLPQAVVPRRTGCAPIGCGRRIFIGNSRRLFRGVFQRNGRRAFFRVVLGGIFPRWFSVHDQLLPMQRERWRGRRPKGRAFAQDRCAKCAECSKELASL